MTSRFHPDDAKLTGVLVMVFGGNLVLMAVLMLATAGYESIRAAGPALLLLWSGLVITIVGRYVRVSRRLMTRPRLFYAGFLGGLWSASGVVMELSDRSYPQVIGFSLLLLACCYAIWKGVSEISSQQESPGSVGFE